MALTGPRLPSDIGGTRLGMLIDREERVLADWELLVNGVRGALSAKGLDQPHERRRHIEELGHELYERLAYHERSVLALESLLIEKGLATAEELDHPAGESRPRRGGHDLAEETVQEQEAGGSPAPVFKVGDAVRVCDRWQAGHVRTPGYVRGKPGRVVGVYGPFRNPETLAYGGTGLPSRWLYTVEFRQNALWDHYAGQPGDLVWVDIYEQWIEPWEEPR